MCSIVLQASRRVRQTKSNRISRVINRILSGPPRLPFFGSYLFLLLVNYKYLHKAALSLSKWYKSDIIGLYVGKFRVAVVHNGEGVREILNNQCYDGRPGLFLSKMRDPGDCVRGGL